MGKSSEHNRDPLVEAARHLKRIQVSVDNLTRLALGRASNYRLAEPQPVAREECIKFLTAQLANPKNEYGPSSPRS